MISLMLNMIWRITITSFWQFEIESQSYENCYENKIAHILFQDDNVKACLPVDYEESDYNKKDTQ